MPPVSTEVPLSIQHPVRREFQRTFGSVFVLFVLFYIWVWYMGSRDLGIDYIIGAFAISLVCSIAFGLVAATYRKIFPLKNVSIVDIALSANGKHRLVNMFAEALVLILFVASFFFVLRWITLFLFDSLQNALTFDAIIRELSFSQIIFAASIALMVLVVVFRKKLLMPVWLFVLPAINIAVPYLLLFILRNTGDVSRNFLMLNYSNIEILFEAVTTVLSLTIFVRFLYLFGKEFSNIPFKWFLLRRCIVFGLLILSLTLGYYYYANNNKSTYFVLPFSSNLLKY